MIEYGLEWSSLDSYFSFTELSATPVTPEANHILLYAKDSAGTSTLCYKNDAGTEVCFPTSGVFATGTGVANRVTIWTGTNTIGSDAGLTYNSTTDILTVTGGLISSDLVATRVLFAGTAGRISHDANFVYNPNGDAGLGKLLVLGEGEVNNARIDIRGYGAASPVFQGFSGAGTIASPTATPANSFLVALGGSGYNNTPALVNGNRALIGLKSGEAWTTTAQGTYITLETTPLLSTTRAERFRVGPSGQWGIGGATFGGSGDIFSSGGASAAPTWVTRATLNAALDHGTLTGLADDDHTQYALLAGRSGGQKLIGGTANSETLTLRSTAHATKGFIYLGNINDATTDYLRFNEFTGGLTWNQGGATTGHSIQFSGASANMSTNSANAAGFQAVWKKSRSNGAVSAGDINGDFAFNFFNTTPTEVQMSLMRVTIEDPTAGNEDTSWTWYAAVGGVLTQCFSLITGLPKWHVGNTTGAGTPLFGTNSPANTNTNPYTWFTMFAADGSTVYVPAWK